MYLKLSSVTTQINAPEHLDEIEVSEYVWHIFCIQDINTLNLESWLLVDHKCPTNKGTVVCLVYNVENNCRF